MGAYFVAKQEISGDKRVPKGTVGRIVARKEREYEYCAVFIKPYDGIECAITNFKGQSSFG